jgi:hypothetical protein
MKQIVFTVAVLRRLIEAHRQAVEAGRDSFTFNEGEFDVGYAGYLIEYLAPRLLREYRKGGRR